MNVPIICSPVINIYIIDTSPIANVSLRSFDAYTCKGKFESRNHSKKIKSAPMPIEGGAVNRRGYACLVIFNRRDVNRRGCAQRVFFRVK